MVWTIAKVVISALLIVAIAELGKRSSLLGAIFASIPLVSVLGLTWLYIDTGDIDKITALSQSIFWLVLPSLVLFIALPLLLKSGVPFYGALVSAIAATAAAYGGMLFLLGQFGWRP